MTAPNPPPRGGAEPRVSDDDLAHWCKDAETGCWEDNLCFDLRDARAECADLRAKLEAAEEVASVVIARLAAEGYPDVPAWQLDGQVFDLITRAKRADAAEAALREMTEQRDEAWKALEPFRAYGARGIYGADDRAIISNEGVEIGLVHITAGDFRRAAALAPPAETAAKEERT